MLIVKKFGGTSVADKERIYNVARRCMEDYKAGHDVVVVLSAMGKTTNALETVLEHFMKAERDEALAKLEEVEQYHYGIMDELWHERECHAVARPLFDEIRYYIATGIGDDYDRCYDRLVSYGELLSTTIISAYLNMQGLPCTWLDMRRLIQTDSNFREATVHMEESQDNLRQAVDFSRNRIYIGQGFIGANHKGIPTTLGREGSDYTAAVVGNLLNAESVTIWKDVPGILNADPRIFPDTVLIPELTYLDAVELAYSGAQIIHPKTIKPLQNKEIPLYVRPFGQPDKAGSVIKATTTQPVDVPVLILRKNQTLVTLRPRDFSFVLEESLSKIFQIVSKHRLKVSLIQSSAISISVSIENSRYLPGALDELGNDFKVSYNTGLELLTIRGINPDIQRKTTEGRQILLSQRTRRMGRFLMKEEEE